MTTVSVARAWRRRCPAVACRINADRSASGYRWPAARCRFGPAAGITAGSTLTATVDDIYSDYAGLPARIPLHAGTHGATTTLACDMRSACTRFCRYPVRTLLAAALALAVAACTTGLPKDEVRPEDRSTAGASLGENAKIDAETRTDFETALDLLKSGKYDRGMELLTRVIQRVPGTSAPYINLAIAQQTTGKLDVAEENLKKALAIDPDHPVANNEYGILYRRTGRFAEARKTYERILNKYPSFIPARKNLAILCDLYMQDFDCALKNYQMVSDASSGDKAVQTWITDVKTRSGR
jgi:Tfp pilus assembly protein PilF